MAVIEERKAADGSKTFRVKIRKKGYPEQTATFERKTDAKNWAQDVESSIREGRYFSYAVSKRNTLADMVDRYITEILPQKPKSMRDQTQQLTYWKNKIGHLPIVEVTPSVITAIRNDLSSGSTKRGVRSNATVNRYLAVMSHMFTIAIKEWEWVSDNPLSKVSKLKESRGRVRYLSEDERKRLLYACKISENLYLECIVVLALSTGARKNEILTLQWDQINFDKQVIILHETKNGDRRLLPLHGRAFDLVFELHRNRDMLEPWLFPSPVTDRQIDIKRSWETAIRKAKIQNFRFHDLRHSTASYLAMSGASMTDIAEVLGHKTLQMVKRYAHLSDAHTSKVVAKMNAQFLGDG